MGPSACLEPKALADHITLWLHRSDLDRRLAFEVTDTSQGVHFVVRRDGAVLGERLLQLEGVPCPEMIAAVGLGVASAIDATILADLAAQPAREIAFTAGGVILVGVLAEATPALTASVDLSLGRRVHLRAGALVTATSTVAFGNGTADIALLAGRLDACVARGLSASERVVVRGCLGAIAGATRARGSGFPTPSTTTLPWMAPALGLEARWSISQVFGVVFGVDGFMPVLRPELRVVDASSRQTVAAYSFPIAGLGINIGPSLIF